MSDPRFTLVVDPIACDAFGACADLVPELIEVDGWGYPIIPGSLGADDLAHARRAVRSCPELALRLQRLEAFSPRSTSPGDRSGSPRRR